VSRYRVGHGFDAHRLGPGRPLLLGGVQVPHDAGLVGHSDGDCVIHALCDALLGAMAAGDMGVHFPSRDPQWAGVSSLVFLDHVAALVKENGYVVENVDVTVVAEAPPLAPHLPDMRSVLSAHLHLDPSQLSVKAKSTDGLGAVGRGEGIAAFATVSLRSLAPADGLG
jgi:2-C-methyl-D-erythritol 2,4-cyclodiphosphate synthase